MSISQSDNVLKVVPSGTDEEVARNLKKRFLELVGPILELCDEADRNSMAINFAVGKGPPLNKHVVAQLSVTKTY